MGNRSYLNQDLTRDIKEISEMVEKAYFAYNKLPSIIRQSANELSQYNNTLSSSLLNAVNSSKELVKLYEID